MIDEAGEPDRRHTRRLIWCFREGWFEDELKNTNHDLLKLLEQRNDDRKRNDDTFIPLYQIGDAPPDSDKRSFVKPENPFHLNERLTTQQGVFLCPGNLRDTFVDDLKAIPDWDSERNVVKLSLSLSKKEAIEFALHLKNMNLGFAALFPGLDGFARSIGQQISHYQKLAEDRAGLAQKSTRGRPIGFRGD